MIVETILDEVQSYLHDDGEVWPRSELLRLLQDAYRSMLTTSGCTVRPFQIDVPGRTASSNTHEWESDLTPGTTRIFTRTAGNRPLKVLFLWEVEALENITPASSYEVVTHLWEQAYSEDTDAHFRFTLPRQTDRPLKVYWDTKRLAHTTVRELDQSYSRWWRDTGEPLATLPGVGPDHSLEAYLLSTGYVQAYNHLDYDLGLPRLFSSDSDREYEVHSLVQTWDYAYTSSADSGMMPGTGLNIAFTLISTGVRGLFSWEADTTVDADDENGDVAGTIVTSSGEQETMQIGDVPQLGVGIARWLLSDDRQYLGVSYDSGQDLVGIPRRYASSDEALTIWEAIVPDRPLTEDDTPDLLPAQLHKYLKYYVLGWALSRQGEGYRPDLAQHFLALFQLGVGLLALLGTPSVLDRDFAREQAQDASIKAPPRVRLPATFPRMLR